ncbi:hypothetical protein PInf_026368 [Phytophthora infestans]|nr:hypothetical protein PInf_026368 [Phytophthora infestans]
MVIGRDIMTALGLVVDFGAGRLQWDGSEIKIVTANDVSQTPAAHGLVEIVEECDDELFAGDSTDVKPADLLPHNLEADLQHCYLKLLEAFFDLYSGRLGRIRLPDYVLPLTADYEPSHAKPYSVARSQEDAARQEMKRILDLDVVEQIYGSEAAAPAFFSTEAKWSPSAACGLPPAQPRFTSITILCSQDQRDLASSRQS